MADGNSPQSVTTFKGIGHWRSQAAEAQRPDTIFAELAEAARRLADKGLADAQQAIHRAESALKDGDHETAAGQLRAAARLCQHDAAAYAQGLRNLADQVDEAAPQQAPAPSARPDRDDTSEHLPALD